MKDKRKRLFSISGKESESLNNKQEYIELVDCPQGGESCLEHRKVISKSMLASRQHLINKDYPLTFKELKKAFYKTSELKKDPCYSCAKFFRSSILQSMENIHNDLGRTVNGFFNNGRLKPYYNQASEILTELKGKIE